MNLCLSVSSELNIKPVEFSVEAFFYLVVITPAQLHWLGQHLPSWGWQAPKRCINDAMVTDSYIVPLVAWPVEGMRNSIYFQELTIYQ